MPRRTRRHSGASPDSDQQAAAGLLQSVIACLNARKSRVLLIAEAALTAPQFKAFRTLFLDEFGKNGLESELAEILAEDCLSGLDRNGQEQMTQERRCHDV